MLVGGGRPRTRSPTSGHPGASDPGHLPRTSRPSLFPSPAPLSPPGPLLAQSQVWDGLGPDASSGRAPIQSARPSPASQSPNPAPWSRLDLASGVEGIIHFCSLHSCQPGTHLQRPGSAWGQWTARPAVKDTGGHNQRWGRLS